MSLLKLAKALYPNADEYPVGAVWTHNAHDPRAEYFTPATNPAQFVEVLAWFLRNDTGRIVDGAEVYCADDLSAIAHNGTAPDIMRAVTEAACRVAMVAANA